MKHVQIVTSKKELKKFIDFPHDLYRNDPFYVPELFLSQRDLLTTHPFHDLSALQCFLLLDGTTVTGRIAAIENTAYNQFHQSKAGFFGFFDVINDAESAALLISAAENWLKERGLNSITGPVNFSMNETCGLLIEGFDSRPMIMMPYNAAYYAGLLEQAGLTKKTDLLSWRWEGDTYDTRSLKLLDRLESRLKRNNITIRQVNMKDFTADARKMRIAYNSSFDKNMGFSPLSEAEFDHQAKDLKMVIDPEFCLFAEKDGEVIGFGGALPDVNAIQQKVHRGRLFPFGLFKLLLGMKKIRGIRVFLLGVREGHRKSGIEAVIYARFIQSYQRKGLEYAEAGWTLEHNDMVNRAIIAVGGVQNKRFRIYTKEL